MEKSYLTIIAIIAILFFLLLTAKLTNLISVSAVVGIHNSRGCCPDWSVYSLKTTNRTKRPKERFTWIIHRHLSKSEVKSKSCVARLLLNSLTNSIFKKIICNSYKYGETVPLIKDFYLAQHGHLLLCSASQILQNILEEVVLWVV